LTHRTGVYIYTSVQYDLLVGVRRGRRRSVVVVVGDVGLRLDVATVGRDAVAAAAAVLAGGQLQAAAREPGEDAPQHPLEHLPALPHERPLVGPFFARGAGDDHRMEWNTWWSGGPAMRAARLYACRLHLQQRESEEEPAELTAGVRAVYI
jgi:hypothetical protein